MATLSRTRALSSSGGVRPSQYAFRQYGSQPVAALVATRRSYWSSNGSKSRGHISADIYHYMSSYPNRALPHYIKHVDGLQYAYLDCLVRSRSQAWRSSSNWAPGGKEENVKSKAYPRSSETPWETRTRIAGERYLRLMEEHMALLRKDPYWSLFGASELRGVWNPWKNSEALRRRVDDKTWRVWEESKKAAEHLRRTVKGEYWNEKGASSPRSAKGTSETPQSHIRETTADVPENEYVYDPISNKRVRRPVPSPAAAESQIKHQRRELMPNGAQSSATEDLTSGRITYDHQQKLVQLENQNRRRLELNKLKQDTSTWQMPSMQVQDAGQAVSSERSKHKQISLAGFARQPWLVEEGFLPTSAVTADTSSSKRQSGWAVDRANAQVKKDKRRKEQAQKELVGLLQDANAKKMNNATTLSQANSQVVPSLGSASKSTASSKAMVDAAQSRSDLARDLRKANALRFGQSQDLDKDLDMLKPEAVRAGVARKTAAAVPLQDEAAATNMTTLEDAAAKMLQTREDRLMREFAAIKWNLKRHWNAYPGDFPRTPEERRSRRELLERAYTISVDLMELQVSKVLHPLRTSPVASVMPASNLFQNKHADPEPNSLLEAQLEYNKAAQRAAKGAGVQNEAPIQKAAMPAYESPSRTAKVDMVGPDATSTTIPAKATPIVPEKSEKQKAQEQALVREIREIYESAYGVISTKHQQRAPTPKTQNSPATSKALRDTSNGHKDISQGVKSIPRPETSLERALKTNYQDAAVSKAGVTVETSTMPQQESRPGRTAKEPEAADELLEASVRDFEHIMSQEMKAGDKSRQSTHPSAKREIAKPATELDHLRPLSQEASDSLTAELAEIAAIAPRAATPRVKIDQTEARQASSPQNFVILAYNKAEDRVRVLKTTSKAYEQRSVLRTVDSIMSKVQCPTSYFDHMELLEKAGYELIAGSRSLLVYKDSTGLKNAPDFDTEPAILSNSERGWGSPAPLTEPTASQSAMASTSKTASPGASRPVRRVEESFSGIPPRLESERIVEEVDAIQKRRSTYPWKVFKSLLVVVAVCYSFGITLEWLKDREKRRMAEKHQQVMERMREVERKKGQEQAKSFGWGL